jgi:hypothetical protein
VTVVQAVVLSLLDESTLPIDPSLRVMLASGFEPCSDEPACAHPAMATRATYSDLMVGIVPKTRAVHN